MNSYPLIITDQYQAATAYWNSLLKVGENICVIFPYLNDRHFRVFQWSQQLKELEYIPVNLNFSIHAFDEPADLEQQIIASLPESIKETTITAAVKRYPKLKLVIVISDGESLLTPQNHRVMHYLQQILIEFSNHIVSFIAFEKNIFQAIESTSAYNKLFQNVLYYPLYSLADTKSFISYLSKRWQITIPAKMKNHITQFSGGSFWLVKEACREFRDSKNLSLDSQGMQFRITQLANAFTSDEAELLVNVPQSPTSTQQQILTHLQKLRFIHEGKMNIPALTKALHHRLVPQATLRLDQNDIYLHGVAITQTLSQTEFALLKTFLTHPNQPITRDQIAKIMWPNDTDDNYSPWAIDQAIKRLRDRLIAFKLPPTIIRSVRGIGYEYRE